MNDRPSIHILRWLSLILILAAVVIATVMLRDYRSLPARYPRGSQIAGIPIGGLDHPQATQRLAQAYGQPIEVHYAQAVFQIDPSVTGFTLDMDGMLAAADAEIVPQTFWKGFWDYLWDKPQPAVSAPLQASYSKEQLRNYLTNEIETRYDHPPSTAFPIAGTTRYSAGVPGTTLDIDQAVTAIDGALYSPVRRIVNLTFSQVDPPGPSMVNLQVLLQQTIQLSQFDGVVEVYLTNLQTSENIHFVYAHGSETPPPLNVAFSGWSTIKIPIMISAMRRLEDPIPVKDLTLLENMIEFSDNTAADRLAQSVIDSFIAPVLVTQDMQTLGLKNTFWGGFFYPSAPLLRKYDTPANSRTDINTGPDPYDQTTPADLGMLLEDIYECAQTGGGALPAAFTGEITLDKCQQMIELLKGNDIPQLIQAGLPYGTHWAHKHGWANEYPDGLIHTMGDAGIAYTKGGNFVMVVFVHDPVQILFDPVNALVAHLGTAAYNFFNPPEP